jgi:uncharacterized membrane-anchored protein
MTFRHGLVAAAIWVGAMPIGAAHGAELAPTEPTQPAPLDWTRGPGTAPIGDGLAELDLGEDYVFLDAEGTRRLMELTQNPVSGTELATVAPVSDAENWFLVFEFADVGYVPDDEKDDLDAEAMLASIREGTEASNELRRERGWGTLEIVGWHERPYYDVETNNLKWAVTAQSADGRSVNRIVKLLGREGVMTATLVAGPEELIGAVSSVDALLAGYRFQPGQTYAEYVPGSDKLAQYGLTALVVGGAGAALVKSGLLAKLWKPLMVALVAFGAGIKRFFGGGRSSKHDPEKPIG